jgi:hypothetical protein
MKKLSMLLLLGSLALAACNRETKTAEHTETTTVTEGQAQAGEADYEAEYRDRANRMADRMATDLQIDTATQSQVEGVYFNRSRRLAEIQSRYNMTGTNQSGGLADTTGMYGEIRAIDLETDNALRDLLSPQQYKSYETNRSTYYSDDIARDVQVDGEEIKVKTGDIKVKAGPGESKVETSTYESKIEGDESKYKSKEDNTKIKSEPGKTKYESGDTKIKNEDNKTKYKSDDTKVKVKE